VWLERMPRRGGNWNNGGNAGVFACNLNNVRSNSNSNIGFRPALGEPSEVAASRGRIQNTPERTCDPRPSAEKHEQTGAGE
jgi:hypothetical protein